jgi:PAS domain S-box-containing protein
MPSDYVPGSTRDGVRGNPLIEVPGYQVREKLSENGPFLIYRGQRSADLAPVLLKVLNRSYSTPKYLARLWQEFEILRLLEFPGVEKAHSLENHQQWWMIVLADSGGQPIDQLAIAGRAQPGEFLHIAVQLARIVEGIHARQVIHKNISPANILYNPSTGQVTLTSFGYASLVSREKVPVQSPYKLAEFLAYTSPELTGRMNRAVDYRTDYYSMGASLYELLTGTPPFIGSSPLELVHAHLALLPDPPQARMEPWGSSPEVFGMVGKILSKLLAKNPEDRYQTAWALQTDLQYCEAVLREQGAAHPEASSFIPGQYDRPSQLNVPQTVIGRQEETETLVQAFDRTIGGTKELVLISGEAGVGKTALANQLIRPVSDHSGFFLYGKFDQVSHLSIYKTLVEILEDFSRLVLSEPSSSFEKWRATIQIAVAPHGQLLTDLCPQLEKVIGPQPAVRPLDEALARTRFQRVVIRFLHALCQPDHPVVIFLDDLQWITGDASLLWHSILSTTSLKNLLIVGAYRDNEVDSEHPIHGWIREMEKGRERVTEIQIDNLEWPLVQVLMATALSANAAQISELTTLIYMRTEGNPYFSIELLKSLYKDHLLAFSPVEKKWTWDTSSIREYGIGSNVVEFYMHQIAALDEDTRKILQYAALIGGRFETSTLLSIVGREQAGLLTDNLWRAMRANLIHPLDESYRLLASEHPGAFSAESSEFIPNLADILEEQILFEFTDNPIQQAVIAMLDEQQVMSISMQVGLLLLEKAELAGQDALQKELLQIVDQLNRGMKLIKNTEEAIRAAELNLLASKQMRSMAAFRAAVHYLSTGIQLLPVNSWQDHYTLTLELYTASAELALLEGNLSQAETLALTAEANARTLLEKARIMNTRMDSYVIQNQLDQVIELGIAALRLLDFELEIEKLSSSMVEALFQAPEMTDPTALTVCRFAEPLISAAFAGNTAWLEQFVYFYLHLFSEFGNPPGASFIYSAYAIHLLSQFDEVEQGSRIGRMALELAERQGPSKTLYAARFMYYAFIHHWLAPGREGVVPLEDNAQPAFEAGNLRFSISSLDVGVKNSLFVGYKLDQVNSKYKDAFHRLMSISQPLYNYRMLVWSDVVLRLMGRSPQGQESNSKLFDEEKILITAGQSEVNKFNLFTAQAYFSLYMRDQQRALETSAAASAHKIVANTHLILAEHIFIYSLALLATGIDNHDLPERVAKVEENLRLMRIWAGLVPQNFLHQLDLVEAELARCLGRDDQAAKSYEQAIQNSKRNGYIHESGLAAELAAEFYLGRKQVPAAIDHLCTAYFAYLAWGAAAKVADLVSRYPDWLPPGKDQETREQIPVEEGGPAEQLASSIDLSTILKASMELAQETNLEVLLRKMMAILMENAGAQNGSLLLIQNDRWVLKVQGSADLEDGFAMLSTPLEYLSSQAGKFHLPISIINYVINLKTDLVLEDAAASRQFYRDAYIQNRRPKSILCAPLMNQGELTGVIYLENNLTTGAFTSDRLEIVRLLSGQAAVSIEKARLYETMESRVQERTRELSDANRRLKEEINQRIQIEEALRLSEVRYRAVFENTGTAMALMDHGLITLVNDKYVELTGYSREELENGFDTFAIVAPEDQSRIRTLRRQVRENSRHLPYSYEFKLLQKAGTVKSVIATSTYLPGAESIIASLVDISERKSAEEALRYNEALLRRVLETLPVGIWILDKDAKVVQGNPEAFRIWSGETYAEWTEFDQHKAWRLDTGERVNPGDWAAGHAIADGKAILNEELEIEAFDGSHRIILNSAIPLTTEQDGLIGAIAVNQDITQRKHDEEELQVAHDQLSTLLDISQSMVSTLDLDQLLNLIIEQLENVMPYEAAAILTIEQDILRFRVIRAPGQVAYDDLLKYQIPVHEYAFVESTLLEKQGFYITDLKSDESLLNLLQNALHVSYEEVAYLRTWLGQPLIAKDDLVGFLVLARSVPDAYPEQARLISRAYANQVAIAIHNAQLYKQAGDTAALEERNRLARELHDSVAQALYSISLFIDATRMALKMNKPSVVENHLEELSLLAREAMSDMRLMIFELRPPVLEKVGLVAALQSRLDAVETRAGFQASFHSEGKFHLSAQQESELYRIVQEALNNVIKHAQANQVNVQVIAQADCVRITVEDDGVGFDPDLVENGGGQGFRNIRERAASIGASCTFESMPGKGTKVTIEVKQ